jgi:hypothetical protein
MARDEGRPKAVDEGALPGPAQQQMLDHASATMTLDLSGHLYGDRLDDVADRMDALRTARGLPADFCGLTHS